MRDIVIKYESLVEDGKWDTRSEKDSEILAFNGQIQELKILFDEQTTYQDRKREKILLTQGLTIVVDHVKQPLQHLVNIGGKKRTGALFTGPNIMNTGLQLTNKKLPNATRYCNK